MKFTFRKSPKETGLPSVASIASVDIKLNKKIVGHIIGPSWQSEKYEWKIHLAVKDGEGFRNVRLKFSGKDEQEAREFLNANIQSILQKYDLYSLED